MIAVLSTAIPILTPFFHFHKNFFLFSAIFNPQKMLVFFDIIYLFALFEKKSVLCLHFVQINVKLFHNSFPRKHPLQPFPLPQNFSSRLTFCFFTV